MPSLLMWAAVAGHESGELRTSSAVNSEFPDSTPATIHSATFQKEKRRKLIKENKTTTIWGNAQNQMGLPSSCWTWGHKTRDQPSFSHLVRRAKTEGVQKLKYCAFISKYIGIIF